MAPNYFHFSSTIPARLLLTMHLESFFLLHHVLASLMQLYYLFSTFINSIGLPLKAERGHYIKYFACSLLGLQFCAFFLMHHSMNNLLALNFKALHGLFLLHLLNSNCYSIQIHPCQNVRKKIGVLAWQFRKETSYLWKSSGWQHYSALNTSSESDACESLPSAEIARVLELLHVLLLTAFSQLPCAFPIHFLHLHAVLSLHLN